MLNHPSDVQLALFAGGDLGFWERWRIRRHASHCAVCAENVQALQSASGLARELSQELPKDLNWDRLAEEMTGNIRVGLAAGEAISRFDKPLMSARPARLGWQAALVLAGAMAVFATAFWTSLPRQQADNLLSALRRVGHEPAAQPVQQASMGIQDGVVLEASQSLIEVKENGRVMSLVHPHSDGVTVSINMRGSAGVRYVDADTGQVTTNKVYYAEQ